MERVITDFGVAPQDIGVLLKLRNQIITMLENQHGMEFYGAGVSFGGADLEMVARDGRHVAVFIEFVKEAEVELAPA